MLVINQTITSKYKHVIHAVRNKQALGMDKERAVKRAMIDERSTIKTEADRLALLSWFNGSFGRIN